MRVVIGLDHIMGGGPFTCAEALFTANENRQLRFQRWFMLQQEAGKAPEVVVMAVADDERVECRRIDVQKGEIVDQGLGREAEVNENMSCLGAALAFHVHRQAKLADERVTRRTIGGNPPTEMLNIQTVQSSARCDRELITIDHDPNC